MIISGKRIEEDLIHHDSTANTTIVGIVVGEFTDPWGGLRNLTNGVLRTPAPTGVSFGDDPLCMMWTTRFASRLGS